MSDLSSLLQDPLAHRALDALMRAETRVTRKLGHELERRGLSPTAFGMLVVVESAGGILGLRVLRQLRDLRRYAPVIIQNNGGHETSQQMNVKK